MWVFCCGMLRSASTLQFQITARLVKEADIGYQVGWIDVARFPEVKACHPGKQELKVVKVHICTETVISEFKIGNALGIYTFRDMRDVYISTMKQRLKSFDFLWEEGLIEQCLNNYKRWTTLPNVLISRYEEIVENIPHEVNRIASHLGISPRSINVEEIAADYTVEVQKKRVKAFRNQLFKIPLNPDDHREIIDYHDEETLLHINHLDSGKIGRWQEDLTESEVQRIESKVIDWCNRNQYEPSLFLPGILVNR